MIEPILVLDLVRARSSWLGIGTEPPADRSPPNRRRIVWMCHSTHTWPIKLCREASGREISDWQTDRRRRRSAARQCTPSHGLLIVMLIEIASVLRQRITGGCQHVLTTPQYPDNTDSAARRRYSCDVIKTLRATEATCNATSKAIAEAIIRGHARVGRLHATRHSIAFNKAYWNFADVFFTLFMMSFLYTRRMRV